jgi:hypothetical protein
VREEIRQSTAIADLEAQARGVSGPFVVPERTAA